MSFSLAGKVSLVTGASRGIGASTALGLAALGSDIVLNFRSKSARAEAVAQDISRLGRRALTVQADLTVPSDLDRMFNSIRQQFRQLDVLILNASGGLEKDKPEDYAMVLNHDAQLNTARRAVQLMPPGGRIVFVTSHWAHFYGQKPVVDGYEVVARSKHAGEQALRSCEGEWTTLGISLMIVSGDAIEGTITPRLLARKHPGLWEHRPTEAAALPNVAEFSQAIVNAAADSTLRSGTTIFVGSTDH
jgi:3-oxoacyl-[acyl-carrier protein] reductase